MLILLLHIEEVTSLITEFDEYNNLEYQARSIIRLY